MQRASTLRLSAHVTASHSTSTSRLRQFLIPLVLTDTTLEHLSESITTEVPRSLLLVASNLLYIVALTFETLGFIHDSMIPRFTFVWEPRTMRHRTDTDIMTPSKQRQSSSVKEQSEISLRLERSKLFTDKNHFLSRPIRGESLYSKAEIKQTTTCAWACATNTSLERH